MNDPAGCVTRNVPRALRVPAHYSDTLLSLSLLAVVVAASAVAGAGLAVAAASATPASAVGAGSATAQIPTSAAEAMALYESDDDLEGWANGPVQYIMLEEEGEIWDDLDNDDRRIDFIDWFWTRRDDDTRDREHPFKAGFYARVAEANQRFPGIPRGWKSDRGRVWVVLGRPDNIRRSGNGEIWTYNTYTGDLSFASTFGELQIGFAQIDATKYYVTGGVGPGAWPEYVTRVFEYVNKATIQDPFLEFDPGPGAP